MEAVRVSPVHKVAQWDVLRFTVDPKHESPEWPDGYRPEGDAPPDEGAWDRAVAAYQTDNQATQALVADPNTDVFAPLRAGTARRCSGRPSWWPTTPPATWARWSSPAGSSGAGPTRGERRPAVVRRPPRAAATPGAGQNSRAPRSPNPWTVPLAAPAGTTRWPTT
jgi:hypothetical protein